MEAQHIIPRQRPHSAVAGSARPLSSPSAKVDGNIPRAIEKEKFSAPPNPNMLLRRLDVKQTGYTEEIDDEEEDMSSIGQDELLAYTKLQLEAAQV